MSSGSSAMCNLNSLVIGIVQSKVDDKFHPELYIAAVRRPTLKTDGPAGTTIWMSEKPKIHL